MQVVRIVTMPNRRQTERLASFVPGSGPDPFRIFRELSAQGVESRTVDLNAYPLNPFAKSSTFHAGIDPVRALSVLLTERSVDAIVCGFESGIVLPVLLRKVFRYRPKILLFEVSSRGWRVRDMALDVVVPRVDGILALTEHQKKHTEDNYLLKRSPEVVGFAVDDEFYRPIESRKEDFILSVGDDIGRDYSTLIEAVSGTSYDVRIRSSSLSPDKLPPNVAILGRTDFLALRALYAQARIVVLPLHSLSSPTGVTTLLEALAMGKPVIASDVGTTRDIIRDGENGILVPPNNPAALRAAIERASSDHILLARLGLAARATINQEFSFSRHVARYASAVRSVLGCRSAAHHGNGRSAEIAREPLSSFDPLSTGSRRVRPIPLRGRRNSPVLLAGDRAPSRGAQWVRKEERQRIAKEWLE
jgi:glycosyltransferase involved in cell wall biosynthesis